MKHILKFNKLFESIGSSGYEEEFMDLLLTSILEYYEGEEDQVSLTPNEKSIVCKFNKVESSNWAKLNLRSASSNFKLDPLFSGTVKFTPIFKENSDELSFLSQLGALPVTEVSFVKLFLESIVVTLDFTITIEQPDMLIQYWEWREETQEFEYSTETILQIGSRRDGYNNDLFGLVFKRFLSYRFFEFDCDLEISLAYAESDFNRKFSNTRDIFYDE